MKKPNLTSCPGLLILLTLSTNLVAAGSHLREPKWTFNTIGRVVATPTIATDGTIYAGTIDDGTDDTTSTSEYKNSFLWAITPGQDEKKWVYRFVAASQQSSPTLSADETVVYVTANRDSSNSHGASSSRGILAAINTATHKLDTGFNKGNLVVKVNSGFGSPKVEPITKEVFLNVAIETAEHVLNPQIEQYLYIFNQNGLLKQDTQLYMNTKTKWSWNDFPSSEFVFNGTGGGGQRNTGE